MLLEFHSTLNHQMTQQELYLNCSISYAPSLRAEGLTGSPNITVSDVNVGGGLSVTGNSFFVGVVTFAAGTDGNIVLGDAATDNVVFNADVNSNIVPNTNNAYDLGSSSQKWRNLFISGNANIGGTLTYEDVTNIDSVGLVTARSEYRTT